MRQDAIALAILSIAPGSFLAGACYSSSTTIAAQPEATTAVRLALYSVGYGAE